jgi:hypothetical protein
MKLKETKKQCLTLHDTIDGMVYFAAVNKDSEVAYYNLMKTKMEVQNDKVASEKHSYMIFLIVKNACGAITNEEFELFKNM